MKKLLGFFNTVIGFFKGPQWKKAKDVAATIGELLPYVETAVTLVSKVTANGTDDKLAAFIHQLNVPPTELNFDPTKTYSSAELQGILMGAARFAVKGQLDEAIVASAGAGLEFGGQRITSSTQIPDNIINSAVNLVYSHLKTELSN